MSETCLISRQDYNKIEFYLTNLDLTLRILCKKSGPPTGTC